MAGIDKKRVGIVARQNEALDLTVSIRNLDVGTANARLHPQALSDGLAPVGGEVLVNTTTAGAQVQSAIAALEGGGYVIVWESGGDVFGQRYSASGSTAGGQFQLNDNDAQTDPAYELTVIGLAGGGFAAAWSELNPQQYQSGLGVQVQRYGSDGTRLGNNILVHEGGASGSGNYMPTVVELADGGFIVAYMASGNASFSGRRYDASGSPVGAQFLIGTGLPGDEPSATRLSNGTIVFAWADGRGSSSDGILCRIYNPVSGTFVTSIIPLNQGQSGMQQNPHVAELAGGGFVITWISSGQDGDGYGVYGRRFAADGAALGPDFLVNVQTAGNQVYTSVAGTSDGGFVVTWTSTASDGNGAGVYARAFDSSGAVVGPELLVNVTQAGDQNTNIHGGSSVTQLGNGDVVFTWDGNGAGDAQGIFKRTFRAEGNSPPDAVNDFSLGGPGHHHRHRGRRQRQRPGWRRAHHHRGLDSRARHGDDQRQRDRPLHAAGRI